MPKLLLILLGCLVPFFAFAAEEAEETYGKLGTRHTIKVGEKDREYYLYAPSGSSSTPRPLVVVMHGGAGKPVSAAKMSGFSELADRENFLVAYPAGVGRIPSWNAGNCCGYAERNKIDDVGFIRAMVEEIRSKNSVDDARIYATGMSNGGMMAYRLACEMGDVFAAIAPVAGAMNTLECKPASRPSVVIFHAVDDHNVLYNGGVSTEGIRAVLGKAAKPDRSVSEAMQFWLANNMCRKFPKTGKELDYSMQNYFCAEDREVRVYQMNSGGHSWPGGKKGYFGADEPVSGFSATETMWKFFKQHPPKEVF